MDEYYDFLRSQGHDYNGKLVIDGVHSNSFHRFKCPHSHKKSNLDATYKIYLDSGIMSFVCYKCGISANFRPESTLRIKSSVVDLTKKRNEEIRKQNELYEKVAIEAENILLSTDYYNTDKTDITHPYLNYKHIKGMGCGIYKPQESPYAELVIPFLYEGRTVNLERIYWSDSEDKYLKRPLKGGRSQGTFAAIKINDEQHIVLICEGYATAATVAMATNYSVVYTRGSSNIKICLPHIKEYFGDNSILIICADNDEAGRKAAEECRGMYGGYSLLPDFEGDYNDWYCVLNDLETITKYIESNIQLILSPAQEAQNKEKKHMDVITDVIDIKAASAAKEKKKPGRKPISEQDFIVVSDGEDEGLYYQGGKGERILVSTYIKVIADQIPLDDYSEYGKLIEYKTYDGKIKKIAIPASFSNEEKTMCGTLMNWGVIIYERSKLTRYLQITSAPQINHSSSRVGWSSNNGKKYHIMPHDIIGETGDEGIHNIVYQSLDPERGFEIKGTAEEWRDNIGIYCRGNKSMQLLVSHAFASALIYLTNGSNVGINYFGQSSIGKSTMGYVCASIFGNPEYLKQSNMTINALEYIASRVNDCLLILDDLTHIDRTILNDALYMLGNGEGKDRLTKSITYRKPVRFRVNYLTTFETPIAHRLKQTEEEVMQGVGVRIIDIQANTGKYGIYENLHGFEHGCYFSDYLQMTTTKYYGAVWTKFIQSLIDNKNGVDFNEMVTIYTDHLVGRAKNKNGGQLNRVATVFARMALAGELATIEGLTGWEKGDALEAAEFFFSQWLDEKGEENGEKTVLIERFEDEFNKNESLYQDLDSDSATIPHNRAGFKETKLGSQYNREDTDKVTFYMLRERFMETCGNCSLKEAVDILEQAEILEKGPKSEGWRVRKKIKGKDHRFYKFVFTSKTYQKPEGADF